MSQEYKIFDPKVGGPLHTLPEKQAIEAFDWFMQNRESRIAILVEHARVLGFDLSGDVTQALKNLHDLFVSEIKNEGVSQRPSSYVFSLCLDIGIYISEKLIQESDVLKWKMAKGKKNVFFQRPALFGFAVKNKNYCVDIDYLLCQYAHRLCRGGKAEEDKLLKIYEAGLLEACPEGQP